MTKLYVQVILTLSLLAVTTGLCVTHLMPSSPRPDNAPLPEFSSARAMRHVEAISRKPHPIGSPELAIGRDYISAQLRTSGLEPSTQHTLATRQTRAGVLLAGEVTNVMTRLAGTESNGAILLMAHYDTVSTSPGAVDNASGIAVLLETMRALKSGASLKHDVIALFTDGEEAALLGAIALTCIHPGTAYVFHWPLLLGLAGLALTSAARTPPEDAIPWGGRFLFISAAIAALLLWGPFIYMFYLWTGFILLAAITGFTALVLGIVIPPLELHRLRHRWVIPGMLLVMGIGFLLAGNLFAHSERPIRYAHAVGCWLDGDSGKAHWVTCPGELDARQTSLFAGSSPVSYPDIFPLAPAEMVLASPAPVAELHGPELSVREDRYENGNRALSLHLAPLQQERLIVHLNPEPKRLIIRHSEDNGSAKTFSLVNDGRWAYLRFDAPPPAGLDLEMDILSDEPVEIRLLGVSTGLPSFPGIVTEPPGLRIGPPDYGLSIPTDFTAVHRRILNHSPSSTPKLKIS